jgi:hypothetical protein
VECEQQDRCLIERLDGIQTMRNQWRFFPGHHGKEINFHSGIHVCQFGNGFENQK